MNEIVDTASAKEFMLEVLAKIAPEELTAIAGSLEVKSRYFQKSLAREAIGNLSDEEVYQLLRSVFATRRSAKKILEAHPTSDLRQWIPALLYGKLL
ncbi:MAG: hypothetical protein IPJ40_07330 [Saprospirales bacterium]|nr:hypothetical protein [Saprospirales bacterium]